MLKPIPGFPGYLASEDGRIWTIHPANGRGAFIDKPREVVGGIGHFGYRYVRIRRGGRSVNCSVHSLILSTFVGPRPIGLFGCHGKNGKSDNSLSNLSYQTPQQNMLDKRRDGTDPRGERNPRAKVNGLQARIIFHSYTHCDGHGRKLGWGLSAKELSSIFNIHHSSIRRITRQDTWSHVHASIQKAGEGSRVDASQ